MKKIIMTWAVVLLCLSTSGSAWATYTTGLDSLTPRDYRVLKVCEGITQLFHRYADSIWPGFSLARSPYIVYIPDRWALLLNVSHPPTDFEPYPRDWPHLGTQAQVHFRSYAGLVGQLAFDLSIDSQLVAAVPYNETPEVATFGFVVHEAFHQFQSHAFGEIPWEREERYPIEDRDNTAFAYLEMRLLLRSLDRAADGHEAECRDAITQFLAVRSARWARDAFVARYEQGQEINEGTAKYVEVRAVSLMPSVAYQTAMPSAVTPLLDSLDRATIPRYLENDFSSRMTSGSVSPEDMRRNRLYPVAAAQGFLLDHLGIDWKPRAQQAGEGFTYAQLLCEHLKIDTSAYPAILDQVKSTWDYAQILDSTGRLIERYRSGYAAESTAFEAQSGIRLEIALGTNGLRRSRTSAAKNWITDNGGRELRNHFDVYSMSKDGLQFELHDAGVLETNDWNAKTKRVIAFIPDRATIMIDGKPAMVSDRTDAPFKSLELSAANVKVACSKPGTVAVGDRRIVISLIP